MHTNYNLINYDYSALQTLKRLVLTYVRPYAKQIMTAIFFMIISAACSVKIVELVQPTIDQIFLRESIYLNKNFNL